MQKTVPDSEKQRAEEILSIFRETLPIRDEDFAASRVAKESHDPFRVLIVTILSQNCTDIAALRAYYELEKEVGVTVSSLSKTRVQTIKKTIRTAGLYKQKAKAIKQLSQQIVATRSGNLEDILNGPFEEVRARLQDLPNVGPKTADVLLSILGQPTISVDTHVYRVSKRLGFAREKANHEEVRSNLMQLFRPKEYRVVPLYFMTLGRKVCKASRPLCPTCPVNELCPYPEKTKSLTASKRTI
ncbi:MAG TPA: endonuclease III [Candidatus Acidoferrales bacterium]|nr:endonuclease III [Candidatus Acidoferrales bacterium]